MTNLEQLILRFKTLLTIFHLPNYFWYLFHPAGGYHYDIGVKIVKSYRPQAIFL